MPWVKVDGLERPVHVRLCRQRRKRCRTCKMQGPTGAPLECDGCDKPLCHDCAVSPREGVDFCPACFAGAWKLWLQHPEVAPLLPEMTKAMRRAAFRRWAREQPDLFLQHSKPLTAAAKK